jgi:hypothetical protein
VLISDPNSLLRNVNFEENGKWRAVWIELNEFDRIDKCSIVALHKEPGRYRDNELPVFRSPWLAKPEVSHSLDIILISLSNREDILSSLRYPILDIWSIETLEECSAGVILTTE